jgi:hypothetical protein
MLFLCHGEPKPGLSEADEMRALRVFASWKPPAGLEIKAHYAAATGGDYVIVETASAAALLEAATTWSPFLKYTFVPIVEVKEGMQAIASAATFRSAIV